MNRRAEGKLIERVILIGWTDGLASVYVETGILSVAASGSLLFPPPSRCLRVSRSNQSSNSEKDVSLVMECEIKDGAQRGDGGRERASGESSA